MRSGHYRGSKPATLLLHRAIWEAHRGPIPVGLYVHHRNGDPADNRLANLMLVTPAEHAAEHPDRGFQTMGAE